MILSYNFKKISKCISYASNSMVVKLIKQKVRLHRNFKLTDTMYLCVHLVQDHNQQVTLKLS